MARSPRTLGLVAVAALLAGCGSASGVRSAPAGGAPADGSAPTATTTPSGPAVLTGTAITVPAGNGTAPLDTPRSLMAPAGTTIEAWARVPGARFETWAPNGDLLVSVPSEGAICDLRPGATPATPPTITSLVGGLDEPQGMAFDAGTLYVAESDRLDRFAWQGGHLGSRSTVASLPGSPDIPGYDHLLKDVVVAPDHTLDVDVGSSGNIAADDRTADPQRAVVEAIPEAGGPPTILARGVRNGDGLAFAPDGALWTAVNERDNVADPSTGKVERTYVNDHPPDEVAQVGGGRDLGWPYCNPTPGTGADPYGRMVLEPDVQTNPGGEHLDCSTLAPIERGLHAHSAPLGLSFLEGSAVPEPWRDGAVIGVHGSNDHEPPLPGAVVWLAWQGSTLGPEQQLISGWDTPGGDRWGRPVDAVAGPGGALYVSDDTAGVVYRVVLPASQG